MVCSVEDTKGGHAISALTAVAEIYVVEGVAEGFIISAVPV